MLLSQFNFLNPELSNYPKVATSIIKILYNFSIDSNYDIIILFFDGIIVFLPISKNSKPEILALEGSRRLVNNIGENIIKVINESNLPSLLKKDKTLFNEKVKTLKNEVNSIIKNYIINRLNK
jgi:hypothetical protein